MREGTTAIIIKDKKILLVNNIKHKDLRIEAPGGKKEEGESLIECVEREVMEELGLRIKAGELIGANNSETPEGTIKFYMYLAEIIGGEIEIKEPEKISSYGWYGLEDLIQLEKEGFLVPNLKAALDNLKRYL